MGNKDMIPGGGKVELCGCPGFRDGDEGDAQCNEDDYGYDDQGCDNCCPLEFGEGHSPLGTNDVARIRFCEVGP